MILEKYIDVFNKLSKLEREVLILHIDSILKDAWGEFPRDFIEKHVLKSEKIILAKEAGEFTGFCCLSTKNVFGKKIDYIEFLVVKKKFQNKNIGSKLLEFAIRDQVLKSLVKMLFSPLELMFITPNMRVLTWTAKFAKFAYPNPYLSDSRGKISPADETTWKMAQDLIKQSDSPNRVIHRDGLVLEGSYQNTPWLIYDIDNIPWSGHNDSRIEAFTKKYLDYESRGGREFVVRVQIGLFSIIKYFISLILK